MHRILMLMSTLRTCIGQAVWSDPILLGPQTHSGPTQSLAKTPAQFFFGQGLINIRPSLNRSDLGATEASVGLKVQWPRSSWMNVRE